MMENKQNSETKQFLGRTMESWAKVLLFYCCFYACVIAFSLTLWAIFYQTLDMKAPKWQAENSLIGSNPGLTIQPRPPNQEAFIWYNRTESMAMFFFISTIDDFLWPYRDIRLRSNAMENCSYNYYPPEGKVCFQDIHEEYIPCSCTKDLRFAYRNGTPCIFLKMNKIFNWKPHYYTNLDELPEKMPQDLKKSIEYEYKMEQASLNTVWVSCEGVTPVDVENIGRIHFFPKRGFPGYFFPYRNQEGYLSPLIALWFEHPTAGVLIQIECKAWAKNIIHDSMESRGSLRFALLVDY